MKWFYVLILLIVLCAALVSAVPVEYSIEVLAQNQDLQNSTASQTVKRECDSRCSIAIPTFQIPEGYTPIHYTLINTGNGYEAYFTTARSNITTDGDDLITIQVPVTKNKATNTGTTPVSDNSTTLSAINTSAPTENQTTTLPTPMITCTAAQCDQSCIRCKDNNCQNR